MTEAIRPGANPNELLVFDHGFVRLDDAMATDLSVVNSARVSFAARREEMDDRDKGLIRFLMRERHGCYDDHTEVLTSEGWKAWPSVTGEETFATLSPEGFLEYQAALRVVHKEYRGHMIGFKGKSIDQMVTPDHNVLVAQTTTRTQRATPSYGLRPAHEVLWRPHRHVTTAAWLPGRDSAFDSRLIPTHAYLKLVGFFIGDGHLRHGECLHFHIRKEREVSYLSRIGRESGLEVRSYGEDKYSIPVKSSMLGLFHACYDSGREKRIPRVLLDLGPAYLEALLDGLMNSDGSRTARKHADRWVYSTTSRNLADSVQELALKIGRSASVREHRHTEDGGHLGSKKVYRVTIYQQRNLKPGLCRTKEQADGHMGIEEYNGNIHCVEVPNGTLYVRRNGYPVWSGNTPFEHNSFRFHIRTPMFVAREWFRHRIGCLTGDTEVTFLSEDGGTYQICMDELMSEWRADPDRIAGRTLRRLDEARNEFGSGQIAEVFDKGDQPVYLVTLADGKSIKMTANHQVLTSEGWMTLGGSTGLVGEGADARITREVSLMVNGVAVLEGETHRLQAHPVKVISVEYVGVERTYDLCVEGPWHNFVANGIVVHNSFNEESARYHKMSDDFYVPEVPAVRSQVGKPGAYTFEPVDEALALETQETLRSNYEAAYRTYQDLTEKGIAKEVARSVLPVGIYTQFYWTINARALMNFLGLRNAEAAQYEIRTYAEAIEEFFKQKMPITYECFVEFGRKAP